MTDTEWDLIYMSLAPRLGPKAREQGGFKLSGLPASGTMSRTFLLPSLASASNLPTYTI